MSTPRRCGAGWRGALALVVVAQACVSSTGTSGEVADIRGTWEYAGTQAAPTLTLEGSFVVSAQSGDVVQGQLSWEERDPVGGSRLEGGPVSGRVIGTADVDFDVLLPSGGRRHVARLTGDTLRGNWIQLSNGTSGAFTAVRASP